jgi:RNA processing factor Prp31
MTQGLRNLLNLPSLDDVLKTKGIDVNTPPPDAPPDEQQISHTLEKLQHLTDRMALADGSDHTEAMNELYKEIVTHARDLMAYGFNIDSPRARGIFEVAATMYGHAMSAANSKREAQMKTIRLALDRKKVDLEERRTNHMVGQQAATMDHADNTIIVEDRNELIKRLRNQIASP